MTRALLCLMALFISGQVLAQQQPCYPRGPFIATLAERYGEVVVFEGLMEPAQGPAIPIILFAAPVGRTWTLASNANPQLLCPFAKGTGFDIPIPEKQGVPS